MARGQADRPAARNVQMASLDMKTAFVAKPSLVSKILSLTGVHGHLMVALLAKMQDVRESACFENSETEFRYSTCLRQGTWRLQSCGDA